jgi:hypothetical protein
MIFLAPYRRPEGDAIEIAFRLPSGQPGLRLVGHPVNVRIDRSLRIEVRSPSSERVILSGTWDYVNGICWEAGAYDPEAELAHTALEMLGALVESVIALFRRGYLDRSWLEERPVRRRPAAEANDLEAAEAA